ncbi:MAG: rRNA maturation RNase YbeY [Proteobacteria bacterium]|nr:rRNA maturation RNase YbeY [Pseudomonadota bacterium]
MASRILNNSALLNPEVSILLLDDQQITELNRQYLGRNFPTDVLAFPMIGDPFTNVHPHLLGDVVVSVETAQRQALKRKHPLCNEIAYLLIHGILHLLDYDHERSEKEDRRMRRMEKKIFRKITEHSTVSATAKKKTAR